MFFTQTLNVLFLIGMRTLMAKEAQAILSLKLHCDLKEIYTLFFWNRVFNAIPAVHFLPVKWLFFIQFAFVLVVLFVFLIRTTSLKKNGKRSRPGWFQVCFVSRGADSLRSLLPLRSDLKPLWTVRQGDALTFPSLRPALWNLGATCSGTLIPYYWPMAVGTRQCRSVHDFLLKLSSCR